MGKPYDGQEFGGAFHNFPLAFDGTGTPNASPVAAGTTVNLIVPKTAARINLLAVGDATASVVIKTGAVAKSGTITLPVNTQVFIDCAGMNDPNPSVVAPNIIAVTAGAASPVSFWFDSLTATGE